MHVCYGPVALNENKIIVLYCIVMKSYFNSNIIARVLRRFFLRIILKRTSKEADVYMRRHQGAKVKVFDGSNVIYHKFSHGAVFYTLNGKMLTSC